MSAARRGAAHAQPQPLRTLALLSACGGPSTHQPRAALRARRPVLDPLNASGVEHIRHMVVPPHVGQHRAP